jgi:PAS domain S-box-containing protein
MEADLTLHLPDFGIGRLFWAIHEAIVVGDIESGRIALFNPAAEHLFGYSAAEAVGQPLEILVAERLRPHHQAGIARYRRTGHGAIVDGGAPVEVVAVAKSGREFSVELSLSPIEMTGRPGEFVLAVIRDITERQQVAEARAGERYFRTLTDTAPVMVWIAGSDGSCTYVNKPWLEPRPTDLGRLIEDTVEDARARTDQHVIVIRGVSQLFALADPLRLEQVLTNLLDNAIKYSPPGSAIEVTLAHADPHVAELSVRDHGAGIPSEQRAHIFERFYRAHGDTHASGMGIGLYISRQIV